MISTLLAEAGFFQRIFFRQDGQATYSGGSDTMFIGLWWLSVATFAVMMGFMIFFTWKYRWSRHPITRSASHNNTMEIAWTVIPTIMVVFIFVWGFRAYARQIVSPTGTLNIDLVAKRWSWDLTYPNGAGATESTAPNDMGAIEVPIFIIPEDTPVKLTMSSDDVIHSFWVPDFRMKQDVFPNRFTTYWFQTEKLEEGDNDNPDLGYANKEHWVFCAEYCGDNHSEMSAILRVVPKDEFAAWIREPFALDTSTVDIGKILRKTKGCVQCHTIDGTSGTGPSWKNLFGYESSYNNAPSWTIDENAVREAVYEPSAKIRKGFSNQMATYQGRLNNKELRAIIAYMKSLSDRNTDLDPNETWGDLDPANAAPDAAPAPDASTDPSTDASTDADTDADAGTDAGTDADTDADAGTGTGQDTANEAQPTPDGNGG